MEGADVNTYMSRFNTLARLVPRLVNPEYVRIERYIWGLAPEIRGMVISSKPDTIQSARILEKTLIDDAVRKGILVKKDAGKKTIGDGGESEKKVANVVDNKRKWMGNSRSQFKKGRNQGLGRLFVANARNTNQTPRCNTCGGSHYGACKRCHRCNRYGHLTQDCYTQTTDPNRRRCYECGIEGHYRNECPKLKGQIAKGKAFEMNAKMARKDSSVVTGTFLVNNHYAYVLFDTGADLSFVSKQFEPLLGIKPSKLENKYSIELANGKLIETGEIIHGCTIQLENRKFEIYLLPVELGSFDIVVGMDWLSRNQAEIVCSEKLVRIPIPNGEILSISGDQSNADLKFVNVMKARKMLRKGYPAFLAHIVDTQAKEHKLEDIPVVRDFPEVFPEDLPGLPPERQVEFRIDLVQDAAPVAKSPYRLAPSEMQELSNQLQELLDKGKANVVADALSRKEREKPLRVRALGLTIQTNLTTRIRDAQREALKPRYIKAEKLRGLECEFVTKSDGTSYLIDQVWVPRYGNLRKLVLDETHKSRYSIHPSSTKMYKDLKNSTGD
ncbi:uncharacterized protein LOC143572301 [Bidens hawaiensis]|uniref:uncharacterized protein LOC143572301 n=1 Tax=Bidens hawaiensis TaxID=980011 RepID=UPI00404905B0